MKDFLSETISAIVCMTIHLCEIEQKIDLILDSVRKLSGVNAFGTDVLADVIGNILVR